MAKGRNAFPDTPRTTRVSTPRSTQRNLDLTWRLRAPTSAKIAGERPRSWRTNVRPRRLGARCRWTRDCGGCSASARQAGEKLALGAAYVDSGYVACTEAGQPCTPGALTHLWREITNAAGVKPIWLHDARHSCGTALHLRGTPTAVIAKWLGHANPVITAQTYQHSQDEALAAAAKTLGQVVNPGR
jgi:hypothetical protein